MAEWRRRSHVTGDGGAALRINKTHWAVMELQNQTERARKHLRDGERLVAALRGMIDEQKAVGASTEATEQLLRSTLSALDRLRTSLC